MTARGEPSRRRASIVPLAVAWGLLAAALAAVGLYVMLTSPPSGLTESEPVAFALPPPAAEPPPDRAAERPPEAGARDTETAGTARELAEAPAAMPEPEAAAETPGSPPPPPPESSELSGAEAAPEPTGSEAPEQTASLPPAGEEPAWQRFARPTDAPRERPRIAVVVTGLGLSSAATEAAIRRLPAAVTLSFSPYARRAGEWMRVARARDHEVMLDLPMEPRRFPQYDPGPQAMMVGLDTRQNLDRLTRILDAGQGYVGVVAVMGSRFAASPDALAPVLRTVADRGLLYLDNGQAGDLPAQLARRIGLPFAVNDRTVDAGQVSGPAIEARLVEVERVAESRGSAVTIGHTYPATIDHLQAWAAELPERGFALVPITAVAAANLQAAEAR